MRATGVRPLLSNAGCRARMLTLMPAGAQPSDLWDNRAFTPHSYLSRHRTSLGRRCGHRAAFTGYRTPSSAALSLRARATGHPSSSDAGSAFQPAGLSNALRARPSAPQRQKYAASREMVGRAADAADAPPTEPAPLKAAPSRTPGHHNEEPPPRHPRRVPSKSQSPPPPSQNHALRSTRLPTAPAPHTTTQSHFS